MDKLDNLRRKLQEAERRANEAERCLNEAARQNRQKYHLPLNLENLDIKSLRPIKLTTFIKLLENVLIRLDDSKTDLIDADELDVNKRLLLSPKTLLTDLLDLDRTDKQ